MIQQGDTIINKRTGQTMLFLKTAAETNGTQLEIECCSPVTNAKDPEHIHPYQENRFRVIVGQLIFTVNGQEQVANPGDVISIPPHTPHSFRNPGPVETYYMQEFFPALHIDALFETFFALARDGKLNKKGAPNIFRTSLIMLKHQKEIRLTKPAWWLQKSLFTILAPVARLLGYKSHYH